MRQRSNPWPIIIPNLDDNWVYRYYYTDEFLFGCAASRHVRIRRLEEMRAWLERIPGETVLDAGCGPGELTALLHRLPPRRGQITSLDFGFDFVPVARELVGANGGSLEFVLGDARRLPFPAETFDLVLSMEMIEHIPDWQRFITEAARVLRPGGTLILSTPTRASFHSWFKRIYQRWTGWDRINAACQRGEIKSYERFLSQGELKQAGEQYGLTLAATKVRIFVFSFLPSWLLPANLLFERILERTPILRQLGVTRFYQFRKMHSLDGEGSA